MNMETIKIIQLELRQFFGEMDATSPSGDENCPWEEKLYQLERMKDCVNVIVSSYEDAEYEWGNLMKILKEWKHTGNVVQKKLDNPYHQADFLWPQQRHRHAYT